MRICLVRNDKMGDMILTLPVVQGLKEVNKDYQIDIVCSKKNQKICENYKSINKIFLLQNKYYQILNTISKLRNEDYDFISEGDSPAFLHLVDVGLDNYENPSRGGWSGRFEQSKENPYRYEDGDAAADLNPETGEMDKSYPQTRWIKPMQLDFAARADWCIKPFEAANHPPKIKVDEGNSIQAIAGEVISMKVSYEDVDNHPVYFKAWSYPEAGDGEAKFTIEANEVNIEIPETAKAGEEFHVIIEGTDTGFPALTRYQRIIVTIH